jgi:CHAT domain-containing protein
VADLVRSSQQGASAVVLLREQATLSRIKDLARGARLLLIATHGCKDGKTDSILDYRVHLSREMAAEEATGATHMSVLEIYEGGLALADAFQVCLTACDLGDVVRRGEEALGFNQAFLSAGAAISLAPLWAVDDAATAELSIAYHRALLSEARPTVAQAMREAIDSIRTQPQWEHPYYWAAFLPSGDGALQLPR